jgi:hypothetical protein
LKLHQITRKELRDSVSKGRILERGRGGEAASWELRGRGKEGERDEKGERIGDTNQIPRS